MQAKPQGAAGATAVAEQLARWFGSAALGSGLANIAAASHHQPTSSIDALVSHRQAPVPLPRWDAIVTLMELTALKKEGGVRSAPPPTSRYCDGGQA